jgi:hypothetical protein
METLSALATLSGYRIRSSIYLLLFVALAALASDLLGSTAYARDDQQQVSRCLGSTLNQLDCGFKADDMRWGCRSTLDVKCRTEACMAGKCCSNMEAGAQCEASDNYYALGCGGVFQEYYCGIDSPNPTGGWTPHSCRTAGNVWWTNAELPGGGVCRPPRTTGPPACAEEARTGELGICKEDGATCESDDQCFTFTASTCVRGRCRGGGERGAFCRLNDNCRVSLFCAGARCVPEGGLGAGEICTDGSQCMAPLVCFLEARANLGAGEGELFQGHCTTKRVPCPLTCVKWIRPGVCEQEMSLCGPRSGDY